MWGDQRKKGGSMQSHDIHRYSLTFHQETWDPVFHIPHAVQLRENAITVLQRLVHVQVAHLCLSRLIGIGNSMHQACFYGPWQYNKPQTSMLRDHLHYSILYAHVHPRISVQRS